LLYCELIIIVGHLFFGISSVNNKNTNSYAN